MSFILGSMKGPVCLWLSLAFQAGQLPICQLGAIWNSMHLMGWTQISNLYERQHVSDQGTLD